MPAVCELPVAAPPVVLMSPATAAWLARPDCPAAATARAHLAGSPVVVAEDADAELAGWLARGAAAVYVEVAG